MSVEAVLVRGLEEGLLPSLPKNLLSSCGAPGVTSGACGDTENKTYVSVQDVLDVIQAKTTPLKWKVILALGRFAGCRGASDLCLLEWSDVIFSDDETQGKITLKGKTKPGTIPLFPVLENLLREWQGAAFLENVDSQKVFPEATEETNVWEMTKKSIIKAGKEVWENPWYSLRDSFCIDIWDELRDPVAYEHYCRHSAKTALLYYQKFTEHRERKGAESLKKSPLWVDFGAEGVKIQTGSPLASVETSVKYRTLDEVKEGVKSGVVRMLNEVLQGGVFNALDLQKIKREIINMLENTIEETLQGTQKNLLAISRKEGLGSQGGGRTRTFSPNRGF